ncbi:hypothetical protein PN36_25745 [Candidatus Thiomargarita nelsonii]|uniref:Uncharacterized protein n=1 Tax=Candidatus Thiomargarita nelsonii TaxID=1003181 RepID=A0A4E0QMW3_9GAMM|nr:hypothetical protein PN36_25745 [Candidatus Thiomargarita nelsonii]
MCKEKRTTSKQISWHRLLGLMLMDIFKGSNFQVEMEKDLTFQEQYLDILIIKKSQGQPLKELPIGLENLSDYNLLTYKSIREPLDAWTLDELIGYYTMYRKHLSPSQKVLLPVEKFQLYAVCTRYPHFLIELERQKRIKQLTTGVYEVDTYTRKIRIIVTSQLSTDERAAIWLLFSGNASGFSFGESHYKWRHPEQRRLLHQLYQLYHSEEIGMSYTWEDFEREYTSNFLESLSPQERLAGLKPTELLAAFKPTELLAAFKPTERLAGLKPTELLAGLTPKEIEDYLNQLKDEKKN